ncbi:MAG: double-strand break repair protein AddB, partial [Hyphomonadaceae bacterium]|nr:double-strand break repair protein AddB [Hyphomonadaceae bacterium]
MASINIFNIPASVPFLPTLAEGLKATYGEHLKDALVFLPTRRAARQLGDLLADEGRVRFLPRLRTLADLDPDEPPFEPGFLADLVSPAMPAMQRRFQLSQLVKRYYENSTGETLNPAGALSLTDPLLAILDDAALEQVDQADLSILAGIEKFVAGNFQNAAEFYRILQDFWPGYVSGENLMEPMARRVALLDALTDLWLDRPPDYPVIIAGSTGTLKATARLMRCVAHQKKGLVLLPALDRHLKASVWETIEDDHPQNSLKCLLQTMELSNMDVQNWMPHVPVISPARRRVISESLVPVSATGDWIERIDILRENYQQDGRGGDIFDDATRGLSLIETRTEDEEALTVALILRETLETDVQTAAFVTPDPALARRVRTRLARWGVTVEYSQGEPLEETRIGGFLTGILKLAQRPHSPVDLAYLLAHPLTALRREPGDIRAEWRALEKKKFREQRPAPGLLKENSLLVQVHHILTHLDVDKDVSPTLWARALAKVAESFAVTRDESGAVRLWTGEDGLQTAGLMENIIAHGDILGPVSLAGFSDLFSCLMRGSVVRPRANIHPRLQILGPLEARMVVADRIVLGGLNEGTWPSSPPHMPFLSRGMRRAIGLSLPERRYGLAAHDFSSLACYPDVIMTRSERSSEGPRVASRWIWRLKTLLRGALGERVAKARLAPPKPYLAWARAMDAVASHDVKPAEPPNP